MAVSTFCIVHVWERPMKLRPTKKFIRTLFARENSHQTTVFEPAVRVWFL